VKAGKLTGQVFLNLFVFQVQSTKKLKYQSGGVIVNTLVIVSIDMSGFVIGVTASTQGKLLAKLVVQALINVCHNQLLY
jgi:hypothetical protein